jgi:hypothetical protein
MAKRALGWCLVAAGLWACGAGSEGAPPSDSSADEASNSDGVAPAERDVAPVARFQFVDTADGMAVEVASETEVTTFMCPTRTCAGLCDECAAQACRLVGELSEACQFLTTSCNQECNCQSGGANCGFPVCAFDRMICYVGEETSLPGASPTDPTDPSPFGPAGRPSESSSNVSRPAY